MVESLKRFVLILVALSASPLLAEQFSMLPQGLLGSKRTLVSAWLFNEGSGLFTQDSKVGSASNLTNHGDLLSGPAWVTGLHGYALNFSATNSRVEVRNEAQFDFMTLTSTWTLFVSYKTTKLFAGIIFSKIGTFSDIGFYISGEADAAGDLALTANQGGITGWRTSVVPLAEVGGNQSRVMAFDYCATKEGGFLNTLRVFNNSKLLTQTVNFTEPKTGSIANDNLAVIAGWDNGTSTSFNGTIDMVALYRGDGQGPLTLGEYRAIEARILGR